MMRTLITAMASALITSQAFAGSYEVRCETRSVPYEETVTGGQPERVIGGAIVGGLIGRAVTDENAGAAVGAIVGGAVGHATSRSTVTKYRDVETCSNVFVPERVTDEVVLEQALRDLNAGKTVSKETTKDVQYTIGVAYDGVWGPNSRRAAEAYLADLSPASQPARQPTTPQLEPSLYSVVVNNVVIVSSADAIAINEISKALLEAGVDAQIFVDL